VTTDSRNPSLLQGQRVILVEDETYVALLLEDMLEEIGCTVVGTAATVEDGLELANAIEADAALLDINVGGEDVFPVARRLTERGIPVIFATGYGSHGLPDEWQGHIVVRKPFLIDGILGALSATLAPALAQKRAQNRPADGT
jgi:DNA-binding response OmpR family regulator